MKRLLFTAALAMGTCLCQSANAQSLMGRNLIRNGDAEASAGIAQNTAASKPPAEWTVKGDVTAAQYDGVDLISTEDDVVPRKPGKNYFAGGLGGNEGSATQTIDLSAEASAIDGGSAVFTLEGYIGGSWRAWSELKAVFKNAAGASLLSTYLDPLKSDDRDYDGVYLRTVSGIVPAGARGVEIQVLFHPDSQAFNFAAADSLSLVLRNATLFGTNVIQNGTFEDGEPLGDGEPTYPIPGWNSKGEMALVEYGEGGGFPAKDDPGPSDRGELFVAGGTAGKSSVYQWIELAGLATTVDAEAVSFALAGFLGGYSDQEDNATLRIRCLDAEGAPVLDRLLGPVTAADRGKKTGTLERKLSGAVPKGARRIEITVELTGKDDYNDGYADNISLVLTSTLNAAVIRSGGVVNAASNATGPIAPGEIISIYGSGLGPAKPLGMEVDSAGKLLTERGGVKVLVNSLAAPLLLAGAGQINAIVPFETSGANVQITVDNNGAKSAAYAIGMVSTAPAIFTADGSGKGQALVLNQDYGSNAASNAAAKGSTVTIFCAGLGATDAASNEIRLLTGGPTPKAKAAVTVRIGGETAEVVFAGAVPYGWPGLYQVLAKVPSAVAAGSAVPVVVTAAGAASQAGVTMAVKN